MRLQRLIPWLAGLLVVQLLVALWLWRGDEQSPAPAGTLLSFDRGAVDRIEISDGENTLKLVRAGDGWVLPELFDFPAGGFRVDGLLDDLAALRPGLAVATSAEAAERFRVADDGYERSVRLLAGDRPLATLYLGDAAGPRRAYGRAAGDGAIYPLTFTASQAEPGTGGWSDKTLLHRPVADIKALAMGDIRLEREGDGWRLTDLAAGETTDQDAAAALAARVAGLNFMAVNGRGEQPPRGEPLLDIALTLAGDKVVHYRFVDPGQDGDPLLTVSDRDFVLRIAGFVLDPIRKTTRDKLVKSAQAEEPAEPAPAASPAQ